MDNDSHSEEVAWSLDELSQHGMLGATVPNSNLKGIAHPLFRYRPHEILHVTEFAEDDEGELLPVEADPISAFEWAFFDPAFKLATRLITHDRFLDWWTVLIHGTVGPWGVTEPAVDGTFYPQLNYPPGDRDVLRQSTLRKLEELCSHLGFAFRNSVSEHWGASWPVEAGVEIELHDGFLYFARQALRQQAQRSGSSLPFEPPNAREGEMKITTEHILRVQWMLAITICHELCHAVWLWRNSDHDDDHVPEPNHCMDPRDGPTPELGWAWEYWLLGFEPIELTSDDIFDFEQSFKPGPLEIFAFGIVAGIEVVNWPVPGAFELNSPITSAYIASWFQEETWDSIRASQATDLRAFVNLTPLTCMYGADDNDDVIYLGRYSDTMSVVGRSSFAMQ